MTAAVQILNLRRQLTGLSLAQLALRSEQPYITTWKTLAGGAKLKPEQAAALNAALDVAEAETEAARRALAVLRGAFSADAEIV